MSIAHPPYLQVGGGVERDGAGKHPGGADHQQNLPAEPVDETELGDDGYDQREAGEDGADLEGGWKLVGDGRDGQSVEDYESGKVNRDGHYKKMDKEKKEMAPLW